MARFGIKKKVYTAATARAAIKLVYPDAKFIVWRSGASDYSFDEYYADGRRVVVHNLDDFEDSYQDDCKAKEQTISAELEREQAAWCLTMQVIKKAMRK